MNRLGSIVKKRFLVVLLQWLLRRFLWIVVLGKLSSRVVLTHPGPLARFEGLAETMSASASRCRDRRRNKPELMGSELEVSVRQKTMVLARVKLSGAQGIKGDFGRARHTDEHRIAKLLGELPLTDS